MTTQDLAGRVRQLEDRCELHELVARYGPALDDHDFATVASLFTEDAVLGGLTGRVSGRDDVVEYFRSRLQGRGPSVHTVHTQIVEFDSMDEAHGVVTGHAESVSPDGQTLVAALRYEDRYVRRHGRWLFAERQMHARYAMPLTDLPTGLAHAERPTWPGAAPHSPLPEEGNS